ncbi:hypothetical protein HW555_000143, partial [Spodoptera exigua]
LQNVLAKICKAPQGNEVLNLPSPNELKHFTEKAKNKYREIKLLFQDIQTGTSSKELLQTLDIDDVKKSTLELENRIKSLKSYLQSELARLKAAEIELNKTAKEDQVIVNNCKKNLRIQTAKYNEIVPSPVKTLITSPFKCEEVQQFQEFMLNSANRYGGWNEYHHNIFVNHWQKYFSASIDGSHNEKIDNIQHYPGYDKFLSEVLPKLQGIREQDIISHIQWYLKFVFLKKQQQRAIDQWRSNRRIIKSATKELPPHKTNEMDKMKTNRRKSANDISYNSKRDSIGHSANQDKIRKSKQVSNLEIYTRFTRLTLSYSFSFSFIRKCYSEDMTNMKNVEKVLETDDETINTFKWLQSNGVAELNSKEVENKPNTNSLENIKKLRIPDWRLGL